MRLHASHGAHPGEEHGKDGNACHRLRVLPDEAAREALRRHGCEEGTTDEEDQMQARRERVDVEAVAAEHRVERWNVEG
jgi:hypothetical protein